LRLSAARFTLSWVLVASGLREAEYTRKYSYSIPGRTTSGPDGKVLVAEPEEHYVAMVDLDAATAFTVPWDITKSGPNDIKVVP
jgi:hypothetical protein